MCPDRLPPGTVTGGGEPGLSPLLEHGPLDAYIVQERSIKAAKVFDDQRPGFDIHARVIVRDGQIVDGDVVIRSAADRHRAGPECNLLEHRALEFQDQSGHRTSSLAEAEWILTGIPLPDLQTIKHALGFLKNAEDDHTDVVDAPVFIG